MRKQTERRRKPRVPLQDSLRITWVDRNDKYFRSKASCLDASETGLRIEMKELPDPASYVNIHTEHSGLMASARIRHLIQHGLHCYVGLELNPGHVWKPQPAPASD